VQEHIEGEFTESTALVATNESAITSWTPSFAVSVDAAIEMKRQKKRFFQEVMENDKHYGVIPGTGTKPTLFKAGAEMLLSNMGLQAELSNEIDPILDFTGEHHGGEPFIRYNRRCTVYRQTGSHEHARTVVARAAGSCSSWEPKYRYRNAERKCPKCGAAAITKSKLEDSPGFFCFAKKGGCGAKFGLKDPDIIAQETGKVINPDIAELDNTLLKMADKRALVAATLIATGCSDIFTQDVEDMPQQAKERNVEPVKPDVPSIQSLMMRAKEKGLCTNGSTFCAWAAENVFGCEGLALGVKPTPDQCLAISEAL